MNLKDSRQIIEELESIPFEKLDPENEVAIENTVDFIDNLMNAILGIHVLSQTDDACTNQNNENRRRLKAIRGITSLIK